MQWVKEYLPGLLTLCGVAAFAIYFFIRSLKKSDDPSRLVSRWVITLVLLPGLVISMAAGPFAPLFLAAIAIVIAIVWTPSWATAMLKPLTNAFDGGSEMDNKPLYSIAEAKRKLGKYPEAIAAIQDELSRHPDDFQGQMMIADIQAANLKDMAAATQTVISVLAQVGHSPANVAYALNRLADWQAASGDFASARQSLEEIGQRFPDTEAAYHASQRLAHLNPALHEAKKQSRRITVPQTEGGILARRASAPPATPEMEDWENKVRQLVAQLESFPADNEAREQLAVIYARQYHQLGLALDQLEQLIGQPGAPTKRIVRWLNLMADLQITEGENLEAARQALQRIVDLNTQGPEAEVARQRMIYLALDLKGQQAGTSVKMAEAEKKPAVPKNLPRLDRRMLPDFLNDKPKE